MRIFLISDNSDTATGLRLAGVEGKVIDNRDAFASVLKKISSNRDIGIILINQSLSKICSEEISEFRKSNSLPVLVEIPDRNSDGSENSIADYVRESIGIKI